MKVKEMIRALQTMNPDAEIEFPVKTQTQVYPVVYAPSQDSDMSKGRDREYWVQSVDTNRVRIFVHLPKGYAITKRKNAD